MRGLLTAVLVLAAFGCAATVVVERSPLREVFRGANADRAQCGFKYGLPSPPPHRPLPCRVWAVQG